jgi:uncharacterized protein YjdB
MKTKILHPIRRLYITAAAFLAGIAGASAYDYTGYDYVNDFASSSGGSISGTYLSVSESEEVLKFSVTSSNGARTSTYTLANPVDFTQKQRVEFDWGATSITNESGANPTNNTCEGQISFQTAANANIFTIYTAVASTYIYVAVRATTENQSPLVVDEQYKKVLLSGPELTTTAQLIHVKAEIDILAKKISFALTPSGALVDTTFEIPLPDNFTAADGKISKIWFNSSRFGSYKSTWNTYIDNLGIKVLDVFDSPTESITITGPSAVSKGQSIDLTAAVLPITATDSVTWSVQPGGAGAISLATTGRLSCTVTASATVLGTDTVVATAGDASGVVAKRAVTVTGTLVSSITIGGDNQLKTFYLPVGAQDSLQLTATIAPDTAENKSYTWTSSRPGVASVAPDGKVLITAATLDTVTITATANDAGQAAASYTFIVAGDALTYPAYSYAGYDYIDLFNTGNDYKNGTIVTSPARGATFSYDNDNKLLKLKSGDTNLGRRQYYTLNKVVEASQKLVVEFDWYAIPFVKGAADDVELQTTFMDAYAIGKNDDPAPHEIFTIYHVNGTTDAFGLVAGPLNADASLSKAFDNQGNGDAYYASRRGATTDESRRRVVTAPLSTWYHVKAEIDIVALNIKFTLTKVADGSAVDGVAPFTLPLPAGFSMVDGVGRLLSSGAGLNGSHTADDRLDNLAIKRADVFTPGQKVASIDITQLDGATTVIAGKTTQLRVKVLPVDAENQKVEWSSLKPLCATVSNGLVAGLAAGVDSTVGIVAAATDGSSVADTFYIDVIAQPITGITVSGLSTYHITSVGTETATITATVSPDDANSKLLTWTTASGGSVADIVSVNATTDTIAILLNSMGPDTIIATANDKAGFATRFPITVVLNPYPGYSYVETFDAGLNGAVQGLRGSPVSIGVRDVDHENDKVLKYTSADGAGRAGAYNFLDGKVVTYTQKAVVEFDVNLQSKGSGEGIISFMSDRAPNSNSNHDVFSIFAVNDTTGFGVSVGYIPRNAYSNTSYYEYVDVPRRVQESVSAVSRGWVSAPIAADIWYHVEAVIYVNERIDFRFTRGADTFRITLPTTDTIRTSIGAINMAGAGNGVWTAAVDNLGIRVADGDAAIPATGVKVSSEFDKVASGGGTIPVKAAVAPWDVTSHAVTWGVVDPAVATVAVDAGNPSWVATLTGLAGGTARVFATVDGTSIADTLDVLVQTITVDSFYIQGSTSVSVGHSITLTKSNNELWPNNAGNKSIVWTSSNSAVASVAPSASGDSCIVTGLNAGESERDSVLIIATAADGGGAADTIEVFVSFTHLTRLDLGGKSRVFYTDAPAGTTIPLTPVFTPSTASDTVITGWESTNSAILTVDSTGVVTLAGGYGKAAAKAIAHDGSLAGYYYVEVARESDNPYDEFTDLEDTMRNNPALKLDTFAFVTNGGNISHASFRNSKAIYVNLPSSNTRGMATQLVDPLTGERIKLRFDFFAGKAGGQKSGAKLNYGSISIKDNSTAPASGNVNAGYGNSILTIAFIPDTTPGHNFLYYTGNDLFSVVYPETDDARLPGTQEQRDASEWGFLPELSKLDAWYTLEATIDNYLRTVSFTIAELDAPEPTAATVANVPFSSTFDPTVGSILIFSRRDGTTSGASLVSAVDNMGYKSVAALEHINVTLHPAGGTFVVDESSAAKQHPAIANEPLIGLPEISRVGYTFVGWGYSTGALYTPSDVYATDTALYAVWSIKQYKVHFEDADIPDTLVNHGSTAVRPEDPERECHDFDGWYRPDGSPWSFTTIITDSVTIVAHWLEIAGCNETEQPGQTSVASGVLSGVALYPNPVSNAVTVTGLTGSETIELFSVSGALVLSRKVSSDKAVIDAAGLSSGAYLVRITRGSASKQLKLIKN